MGDELTGLTYLRARYYDLEIGRFTQEDVIYDGFNLYAYCGSNPVIYCDPSGFTSNLACEGKITAGKNFKDHYIRHKKLLESIMGNKYGKFKEDADKFLNDIFNVIKDGKVKFVGNGTLNITMTEPCKIFRGSGITIVLKKNNEFVTLLESGVGMDLKIQFIK